MRRILPDPVVGALAGFAVGCLAYIGLGFIGLAGRGPSLGPVLAGLLGAVAGGVLGALYRRPSGLAGALARWCVNTAAVVGCLCFLAGFAGPILLTPGSPQGPLLGIFVTGPLGTVVGALLGLVIGVAARGGEPRDLAGMVGRGGR